MSSSTSTTVGNVMVVTHVLPVPQNGDQHPVTSCSQRFRRGSPQALGTVQIMIGLITLLFGIAGAISGPMLGVFSGIFVWGALIYISAGALTVSAEKKTSRCLVNASLILNIIAAVVALTAVILFSLDTVIWEGPYDPYDPWRPVRYTIPAFAGMVAVFQFLEFVVSITVAGFACNASCHCCNDPPVMVTTVDGLLNTQAPPTLQPAAVAPAQYIPSPQMAPSMKNPQAEASLGIPPAYQAYN